METIIFDTYPPLVIDDEGNENENYDYELRVFEVPKEWAVKWVEQEDTWENFMQEYTWDETYWMYLDADAAGVIISDTIEPR